MSNTDRPNCMHCGEPAEYICGSCEESAICEAEDDPYCPNCGQEDGVWEEYKPKRSSKK